MHDMNMTNTTRRSGRTTRPATPHSMPRAKATTQPPQALAKGSARVPVMRTPTVNEITHKLDVVAQVELACRARPQTIDRLVRKLEITPSQAESALRVLRLSDVEVLNIGTSDRSVWWIRPGDDAPAGKLLDAVMALIAWRPLTMPELMDLTGARRNRLSGVIVRIKERMVDVRIPEGERPNIQNLGTPGRARWFLAGVDADE